MTMGKTDDRKTRQQSNRNRACRPDSASKKPAQSSRRFLTSTPIAFFIAVIIMTLGTIQLASTFHTYALNLAELNSLRSQEAALSVQKAELENDIARWKDKAYITAQARERLGFVFPGERSVRVLHPEVVGGEDSTAAKDQKTNSSSSTNLPWYKEIMASISKADEPVKQQTSDDTNDTVVSPSPDGVATTKANTTKESK